MSDTNLIAVTEIGLQLQFIVIPIVFVALSVIAIGHGIWYAFTEHEYPAWVSAIAVTGVLIMGIAWAIAPFPYNSKYWPLYEVSGTIESISNGVAEGDDLTYRVYVVELEGDPRPYLVDDARITALQGQDVSLKCQIEWVYEAADQWHCDIRSADYTSAAVTS